MVHTYIHEIPDIAMHPEVRYASLREKAALVGLPLGRIAKTTYWWSAARDGIYGAVVPGDCAVDVAKLCAALCPHGSIFSRGFTLAKTYPWDQRPGYLGPFITEMDVDLVRAIVFDDRFPKDPVDFAHPAEKTTRIMVPVHAVRQTLEERFGTDVLIRTAPISAPMQQQP